MNKYLKLYFLDSLLMIGITILVYYLVRDNVAYDFSSTYICTRIILILAVISLFLNIIFVIARRKFKEENTLFPKFFLIFFFIIVFLAILMNRYMYFKYVHTGYYYGFIIFNYLLLSVYTNLSFNFKKKKNK